MTWSVSGRGCCVQKLKAKEVRLLYNGKTLIHFNRGKTASLTEQVSNVHTELTPEYATIVRRYLKTRAGTEWLFGHPKDTLYDTMSKELLKAMRRLDPKYTQRGLRRGAAQELSRLGATEGGMMRFTNHKTASMLRLYLGEFAVTAKRGQELGRMLLPAPIVQPAQQE
jgi:hypothetical protein